jgi:hypothetical protein
MTSKNGGANCWGGSSGVYNPNPASNANELIAQMNEELKQAKFFSDAAEIDVIKIKNRNFIETAQVSIFGGNIDTGKRIEENCAEVINHSQKFVALMNECNCKYFIKLNMEEYESINQKNIEYYSIAIDEQYNKKGMIADINKAILNPPKSHFADPDSWKWHGID